MILGFFSDAHGNEIGFTKCYKYLAGQAEMIYYLGDAVGYFPISNYIINTLRENNIASLKGNHEAMLLEELTLDKQKEKVCKIEKGRKLITEENRFFLKKLSSEKEVIIEGRKLLLVHGSPFNSLEGYVYPDSDISLFEGLGYDAIFMGHTHRAFIKNSNKTIIVNVGSCGLPRDIGNKLTVALYDTKANKAFITAINMNVDEVIRKYGTDLHSSVIEILHRNNKIYDSE